MKTIRKLSFLLALLMVLSACLPTAIVAVADEEVPDNPGIISGNAVVAYARNENRFLYNYRLDEKVAPVVAAKLMTCMVVWDIITEYNLSASKVTVTVTEEALALVGDIIDARVPTMSLDAGEKYTAEELISATLAGCANDAAASLAVHFAKYYLNGNVDAFVARMNQKAKELGLERTQFENPTGFNSPGQHSTPREIALIASAFYGYNDLVYLADVESFAFNGNNISSKNALKSDKFGAGFKNSKAVALAAGQLDINGNYCLIAATEKEGKTYIFVVMCATGMIVDRDEEIGRNYYSYGSGNAYYDMNKLINWVRDSFELVSVASRDNVVGELHVDLGNSSDHVMVIPAEDIECLLLKSARSNIQAVLTYDESLVYKKDFNGEMRDTVKAPISTDQQVGTIVYTCDGLEIARVNAVVKEGVELDSVKNFFARIEAFLFGPVMKAILIVILVVILLYIIAAIASAVTKAKNKAKKSQKKKKDAAKVVKDSPKTKPDSNSDTKEMR